MATENPKISLYVPQHIYDRFMKYKEESGLSMSQAGTVLLAQHFGLEATIKDIIDGVTIGGITLDRVEKIEDEIKQLKEQINNLVNQGSSLVELPQEEIVIQKETTIKLQENDKQSTNQITAELPLRLTSPDSQHRLNKETLAKRLKVGNPTTVVNAANNKTKPFDAWSKKRDPDEIAWKKIKIDRVVYFQPISDTPSELLSKLQEWLKLNV